MSVRKRFNDTERKVIADAAASAHPDGGLVAWQNVSQWHRARIARTAEIKSDGGWQYVEATNLDRTARLSPGYVIITPGHIRAYAEPKPSAAETPGTIASACAFGWSA